MKVQIMIQIKTLEPKVFENTGNNVESYKTCSYCGQNRIPFKMGVCICGAQVGNIQYVKDSEMFAKNYYSYIGTPKVERLEIVELIDN